MNQSDVQGMTHTNDQGDCTRCGVRRSAAEWWGEPHQCDDIASLRSQVERLERLNGELVTALEGQRTYLYTLTYSVKDAATISEISKQMFAIERLLARIEAESSNAPTGGE